MIFCFLFFGETCCHSSPSQAFNAGPGGGYVLLLLVCLIRGKKKKKNQLTLLNEGLVLYITVLRLGFLFLLLPKIKDQTTSMSSVKVKAKTFPDVLSAIHWAFASKPQLHVWTVRHPSPTSLLRRAWIVLFSPPLTGQLHISISCTTTSMHGRVTASRWFIALQPDTMSPLAFHLLGAEAAVLPTLPAQLMCHSSQCQLWQKDFKHACC